jgi:hypothetical protein
MMDHRHLFGGFTRVVGAIADFGLRNTFRLLQLVFGMDGDDFRAIQTLEDHNAIDKNRRPGGNIAWTFRFGPVEWRMNDVGPGL